MEVDLTDLKTAAKDGIKHGYRHVFYRLALDVLTGSDMTDWKRQCQEHRARYAQMKSEYMSTPDINAVDDLSTHNPLSNSEKSIWSSVFANQELCETIDRGTEALCTGVAAERAAEARARAASVRAAARDTVDSCS